MFQPRSDNTTSLQKASGGYLYRRRFGGESINRRRFGGTSLVETLVSMTLLGVIFIPMLFLSSAFFLAQLAKSRQNVDVSVNAARFANQFMEELNLTQRLLPESNTTEIHFSYYDSIRQMPIKRGYRLSDNGGYRLLERLNYDATANTWTTQSPYGTLAADQVLLPATAAFDYCDTGGCGMSAKNAVFVRLANWEFMPKKNVNRKVDFPTLDVHLSAGASAGGVMLSQAPQELYSFSKASSFGSGASLYLVNLNPNGRMFNYSQLQATLSAGLSTIVSSVDSPGVRSTKVSPTDGRVYFGQNSAPAAFWTWKEGTGSGTGLSTIASGLTNAGYYSTGVSPVDGRVYFGQQVSSAAFRTWREGVGLSTIVSGVDSPGALYATAVSSLDGRVYFGQNDNPGKLWSWIDNGSGGVLSTIITGINNPGYYTIDASGLDSRVYFGQFATPGNFWTWKPGTGAGTGLSTILTSMTYPGVRSTAASPIDGRVYIGQDATPGNFWTWKDDGTGAGVLSTIISDAAGLSQLGVQSATAVSPVDGRVYFGQNDSPGNFWTWKENGTGAGVLSTIVSGVTNPGVYSIFASPYDGRIYFGQGTGSGNFWTWKENGTGAGVLSTIITGVSNAGQFATECSPLDGRVFFGSNGGTVLWTWKEGTGAGTGLSTIITSQTNAGVSRAIGVSPFDGRVFFGQSKSAPATFWTWQADVTGTSFIPRVTVLGKQTSQPLQAVVPLETLNYTASFQDVDGDIYLSDAATKKIDRYGFDSGSGKFSRKTQFSWTTSTGAVGALAVDQATTGIALLDTANKQIDVYSNRKATGSPAAGSQFTLSATTAPTGLAVSGRTGNYLVLDSAQQGINPNRYVRLFAYNSSGIQVTGSPWKIYLSPGSSSGYGLSVDATSETNFKIQYDDEKNILYLIAPNVGRIYALMLPETF